MLVSRAFLAVSKCRNCRYNAVRAFVSWASIPQRPLASKPVLHLTSTRSFTIKTSRRSDSDGQDGIRSANVGTEEEPDADHTTREKNVSEPDNSLPWYLQVETPRRKEKSLLERQQLPELPPDSPPLLQPILHHLSTELGFDDLILFDLRELDPPSGLGAKLIMILGTARSKRHLQMTADKFCRWLRKNHKLRPHADGLIGRGILRTAMKRKARRAKLLSSVGSSEKNNEDKGVSSTWVCVQVGTVEDGEATIALPKEPPMSREGFVGFDERVEGTNLVVQMMTQEKREELDLEELWGNMLESYRRKQERSSQIYLSPPDQEVGNSPLPKHKLSSDSSSTVSPSLRELSLYNREQNRELRERARNLASDVDNNEVTKDTNLTTMNVGSGTVVVPDRVALIPYAKPQGMRQKLRELLKEIKSIRNKYSELATKFTLLVLEAHLKYLASLPQRDAIEALGNGIEDFASTSFLTSFYESFPLFPEAEHWGCRINLVCYAIDIGHPQYERNNLLALFDELRISLIHIPARTFWRVFETLLSPRATLAHTKNGIHEVHQSLRVLGDMALRGLDVYSEKALLTLYTSVAHVDAFEKEHVLKLRSNANSRLRLLMDDFGVEHMDTQTQLEFLNAFVLGNNWEGFWAHWRGIALRMQSKSQELYTFMFCYAAWTRDQRKCIDVLQRWIPEMAEEKPPVELKGELTVAVMDCLRVAVPSSEEESMTHHQEGVKSEWVQLWDQCRASIAEPRLQSIGNT